MHDLSELNEINRLLITRYQEHEDREANLDDEENRRSSRNRCRYTDQIERLEQQLEDLRLEYEVASSELQEGSATLEDRNSRLESMRVMLENRNNEVTHTREERDHLQLRHNEAVRTLARSATTRAQKAETLKDRQLAALS